MVIIWPDFVFIDKKINVAARAIMQQQDLGQMTKADHNCSDVVQNEVHVLQLQPLHTFHLRQSNSWDRTILPEGMQQMLLATLLLRGLADNRVVFICLILFHVKPEHPAGSLLVVPAGLQKSEAVNASINVAYIFARGHWSAPLLQLPVAPKVLFLDTPDIRGLRYFH